MPDRPPRTLVVIIDGTLSRLTAGHESNAGLLYKLLKEAGPSAKQSVFYDPGIQGSGLRKWLNVAAGLTINQSIEDGYATLASQYKPGDKIMLFGYSRGAYAVRSLAGFIGRVGLLRSRHATQRRVHRAFRYYEQRSFSRAAQHFSLSYCHPVVPIECIGVWDTVKALGLPYPILSRLAPMATEFHDHHLGDHIHNAFQALAVDETRTAYLPMPWQLLPEWRGQLEQAWFPGMHADVGGQLGRVPNARPLGNIPLRWMLERAVRCGLDLPQNWEERFPTSADAPSHGLWRGSAPYFILRRKRIAGRCGSEYFHDSVEDRQIHKRGYRPTARWIDDSKPGDDAPMPDAGHQM